MDGATTTGGRRRGRGRRRGADAIAANRRAIKARSEANRRARLEGEGEARGRRATARTLTEYEPSPRAKRDLETHAELGARRRESIDAKVQANDSRRGLPRLGEVPKYLARRRTTLLREMNERMERALEDIERRRDARAEATVREREMREERRRENERRRAALARRAEMDAAKPSPRARAATRQSLERARELFARAKIRVDEDVIQDDSL